jgi:hypothetical protein
MTRRSFPFGLIILTGLLLVTTVALARDPVLGWYFPLNLGASWTYENVDDPFDTYTETVFEIFEYEGHPAYKKGRAADDYVVVYSFRGVVTVYAVVLPEETLDLEEDLVLDDVFDADTFEDCFETPCETVLIRIWENLDPTLRSIYDIDPDLTDMLMFAAYDASSAPNIHNTVVESNLPDGVTPPAGGITDLDWYLRGVGLIVEMDIDAPTGGIEERFELVSVSPVADIPDPGFHLHQNHPNPFNPSTTISFELVAAGPVQLRVFDSRGRLVRTLLEGEVLPAGPGQTVWRGRDDAGLPVAAGVYFSQLAVGGDHKTRPMMLVK